MKLFDFSILRTRFLHVYVYAEDSHGADTNWGALLHVYIVNTPFRVGCLLKGTAAGTHFFQLEHSKNMSMSIYLLATQLEMLFIDHIA